MATPDAAKPMSPAAMTMRAAQDLGFEADFADLAARFAAKSGGGLSPDLSADLALEIVLNEIVEQGCQVTGATGAAIILDRDGELVCRASSGSTAPELGARIGSSAGFAQECLGTRKTIWCDDTSTDPRAETEPSRQVGVRSIAMMPLLRGDVLMGVFGLFSTLPYAFGVRDERTLEILVDRTLTNLEHASQPFEPEIDAGNLASDLQEEDLQKIGLQDVDLKNIALQSLGLPVAAASEAEVPKSELPHSGLPHLHLPDLATLKNGISGPEEPIAQNSLSDPELDTAFPDFDPEEITPAEIQALLANAGVIQPEPLRASRDPVPEETRGQPPRLLPAPPEPPPKQADYVTWALGFAVASVAVLLGLVLGQHFLLSRPHLPARTASAAAVPAPTQKAPDSSQTPTAKTPKADIEKTETTAKDLRPPRTSVSHEPAAKSDQTVPPGGLLVFENGKEVFRLPPTNARDGASAQKITEPASELEPDSSSQRVVEIPEATAQRELLHRVEPEYPEAARQQNIEGAVALELHIGTNGSVEDVQVLSGPPLLAQASTDAVKQWKFKPRVVNGTPVEMQTRVTFNFKLPQ
jgi:periplasmic protein TonB